MLSLEYEEIFEYEIGWGDVVAAAIIAGLMIWGVIDALKGYGC